MTYSKRLILFVFTLFITISNTYAAYLYKWENICWDNNINKNTCTNSNVKAAYVDLRSIVVKNDSIYYAVNYYTNGSDSDIVGIIQYKNGKVGIVETMSSSKYLAIMNGHGVHPTFNPSDASEFKELNKDSIIYKANNYVTQFVNNEPSFWKNYFNNLENKMKKNWTPTNGESFARVNFKINRQGQLISDVKIKSSSGIFASSAAINAVKSSAPFEPFPKWSTNDSLNIDFTFNVNRY